MSIDWNSFTHVSAFYLPGTCWVLRTEWDIDIGGPSSDGISDGWETQAHKRIRTVRFTKTRLQCSGDAREGVPNMIKRRKVSREINEQRRGSQSKWATLQEEKAFNTIPGSIVQLSASGVYRLWFKRHIQRFSYTYLNVSALNWCCYGVIFVRQRKAVKCRRVKEASGVIEHKAWPWATSQSGGRGSEDQNWVNWQNRARSSGLSYCILLCSGSC